MKRFWFLLDALSTRARLIALLLLVIIPYSALLIYSTVDRYQLLKADAQSQVLNLAKLAAKNQEEIVEHTRQLLTALINSPTVKDKDWARCNVILPEFWQHFNHSYSNFHVADMSGNIVCSGMRLPSAINIADRKDFQDVVASRKFVVGDLVRSRTTNLLSLIIRAPVLDSSGQVVAVVSAQISTEQFAAAAQATPLPDNGELLITDRSGKVIVRQPGPGIWIGERLPDGPLTRAMLAHEEILLEATGVDGTSRMYGVARTSEELNSGVRVAIGFPLDSIHAAVNRNLYKNIATMVVIVFCVLVLAWFGVDILVLRKVRILIDTVRKIRDGETSARTGLAYGVDELSHVARAIDETAEELERILNLLREQTIHDPLTALYNRRYLEESLNRELGKAARDGKHVGIIMADIDHFKQINDTLGHAAGDAVLIGVAKELLSNVRGGDIVCRFGGEEFAIILPGANLAITMARAEALRECVSKTKIEYAGKPTRQITISLGVAIYPISGSDSATVLKSADTALYNAKGAGRNQVATACS